MNEAEFIAALRTLPLHPGAEGLRDDTATLAIGGETLILTHDAIAEGVHYRPGTDPFDIAWKLVAVNLSDLAAKGAAPLGVLVGALSGLPAWLMGKAYLTHLWAGVPLGFTTLPVSTVLVFDLGVYLCVWGALGGYAIALLDSDEAEEGAQ